MRLLIIAPFYRWFIKDLVETQSEYVDKIHVLVHHNPLADVSNYISLGGYLEHLRLYTKQTITNLNDAPSNVNVHVIDMIYLIPDGKNPKLGYKLFKKFKKHINEHNINFDMIHAHFTYPQGYVAVKLGKEFNVPVIITAHGHDVYEMPFRDYEWRNIITWTLEQATYITTVSYWNKEILTQRLGINERKISVIPNGYNAKRFTVISKKRARKTLGLPENRKIILNVGNLYPVKGHKYLIDAMTEIVMQRRDVLCIIVGAGSLRNKLEEQIKQLDLGNYVKLAGPKPHEEIPLWMNAADLFVLPSLSEGNPTVMFEALGVGLPFVGTTVGGVPGIITSEDYGLLCPPKDPECLAEKILMAIEKDWDKEKIRRYAEQFTWDHISKEYLKIYHSVIDGYHGGGLHD